MDFIKIYLLVLLSFFVIDMFWLGLVAKKFYREQLGYIMAERVNWPAAIIFYLLYIGGLVYFAVLPAVADGSAAYAFIRGAFLGLLCYATYDLTNLATIKKWPLKVTIVDLVWGSFLSGILTLIGFLVGRAV